MANFTKQAIKSTFTKLLDEKPLGEISVKMIVEDCGINRKSFYYHFRDIPSLLEEIVLENIDVIIGRYKDYTSVEECVADSVNTMLKHKRLIRNVYKSLDRDTFEKSLLKICDYAMRFYIDNLTKDIDVDARDKEILVSMYRSECFGLICEWMLGGMTDDILQPFHRVCELRGGMIEEMIRRCNKSSDPANPTA